MRRYKRNLRRPARKGVKFAAPKGQRKVKQVYKNLSSRIKKLERATRPEKKHYVNPVTVDQVVIGQAIGLSDGYYAADVTPYMSQGTAGNARIGDQVKLKALVLKGCILGQSSQSAKMRVRVVIAHTVGEPWGSGASVLGNMYDRNPLTTLYDYNSTRATDTYKNFRVLYNKTLFVPTDRFSGAAGFVNFTIALKLDHLLQFVDSGAASIKSGQLTAIFLCDSGNGSATIVSTAPNMPVTAINTGAKLSYKTEYYYTDA